ncbi:MAG TPA: tyrosine-protein kinase family protein [Syntrophomonadaceae bacterium]|nr:tyrosine-protein kinase family protein [Syntrophomonadaceae bacterium]
MHIISIISSRRGVGQTTVAINLAVGLLRKGYRVLFCNVNSNPGVYNWLEVKIEPYEVQWQAEAKDLQRDIYPSALGIDLLYPGISPRVELFQNEAILNTIYELPYDYFIINPGGEAEELLIAALLADNVIACTDLRNENELHRLSVLQEQLNQISQGQKGLNLILPCKIVSSEWDHNTTILFSIAEYFGYEKIGDFLPSCERIHSLPDTKQHIWQLQQSNIKQAFNRLVERVEKF